MNSMLNMSASTKKEIETLQKTVYPFTKKISRYSLFALPLVVYSVISLIVTLYEGTSGTMSIAMLIFYAAIGAVGIALYKEAKAKRKEVQQLSIDFMTKRIKQSHIASDYLKDDYIKRMKQYPMNALYYFVEFLEKEEQRSEFQS